MSELPPLSYLVLGLIERADGATPYELKQLAATVSDLWALRHDQVYREPERLAKRGLLSEEREQEGRRRRHFQITEAGRQALREWLNQPTAEFTEMRDPGLLRLFLGADPAVLAGIQLEAHEKKLHEYEEMAKQVGEELPEGMHMALQAGVGHEREWVRFWGRVRDRK
ncbi:MAG TPA: PadR family transcriptional regulator [Solirubrobacterales bacterium]|nr:PadR family transcriptional regulator [Solirubrobacterales bacterium]